MFVQILRLLEHVCAELRLHLQHGFDVDPTLSPILGKSLLSPDQAEAIALDLCKSVQKLHNTQENGCLGKGA